MLELHDPVYGAKFGIEIADSLVFFPLHLLDQLFELVLCSIDLLFKHIGPFLQISLDVTHQLTPAR